MQASSLTWDLLNLQHCLKIISFNVWVRYFMWNFKGTLWNSTQNILPIQCTPDIYIAVVYGAELDISQSHARYFSRNHGNFLDPVGLRQFFVIVFVPGSQETIFDEINSNLPVNMSWKTCCAMVSQARRSIDTSILWHSRVQLIQCQFKSQLQIVNFYINKAFLIKSLPFDHSV